MDKKKNTKIDAARPRKTGVSRCFKKRLFKGNSYTKKNDLTILSSNTTEHHVSSAKKLRRSSIHIENSEQSSCLLIDMDIFSQIINIIGSCPSCESNNISFIINPVKKKGLSSCLEFSCQNCSEWTKEICTSKELHNNSKGKSSFDINVRSVLPMSEIGRGYSALEKLCGYLNLSPPIQVNAFDETQKTVLQAHNTVALQSMTVVVDELQENKDEQGISDVTVSCDDSWQRWGDPSLNGVVTRISSDSGKWLDYRVMTKICKAC